MPRFIYLFLFCSVTGCGIMKAASPRKMDAAAYIQWYNSDAYTFRDTVISKDIVYILEQVPVEVELARSMRSGRITVEDAKQAYKESNRSFITYQLILELPAVGKDVFSFNPGSGGESDRPNYFAFDIKNDFFLLNQNGDTIDCSSSAHERGMSNFPRARFTIDFTGVDQQKLAKLVFRDRYLSESIIDFDLQLFRSQRIPHLIFK